MDYHNIIQKIIRTESSAPSSQLTILPIKGRHQQTGNRKSFISVVFNDTFFIFRKSLHYLKKRTS